MRTTWQLARDAGVLWLGHLPGLVTWACLGYAGNLLGQHLSTQLAANRLASTLAFLAGIMWWLACTVLMVHSQPHQLTRPVRTRPCGRRDYALYRVCAEGQP